MPSQIGGGFTYAPKSHPKLWPLQLRYADLLAAAVATAVTTAAIATAADATAAEPSSAVAVAAAALARFAGGSAIMCVGWVWFGLGKG